VKTQIISYACNTKHFSIDEAAKELGVHPGTVLRYMYGNKLTTFKFKGFTLISRDEIARRKSDGRWLRNKKKEPPARPSRCGYCTKFGGHYDNCVARKHEKRNG
jgi:hypothetical protein